MKFATILIAALIASPIAQARSKAPSCNLPDSISSEELAQVGRSKEVGSLSPKQIHALPSVTKQQLILSAQAYAVMAEETRSFENSVEAVHYLSQMDGPVLTNYKFNGEQYTEILYYPGENPYGHIFARGTSHIVADIYDGDISCR